MLQRGRANVGPQGLAYHFVSTNLRSVRFAWRLELAGRLATAFGRWLHGQYLAFTLESLNFELPGTCNAQQAASNACVIYWGFGGGAGGHTHVERRGRHDAFLDQNRTKLSHPF